jgi:hypothetical protein
VSVRGLVRGEGSREVREKGVQSESKMRERVRTSHKNRAIEEIESGVRIDNSIPVGGLKSSPPFCLSLGFFTIFLFPLKQFRVRP